MKPCSCSASGERLSCARSRQRRRRSGDQTRREEDCDGTFATAIARLSRALRDEIETSTCAAAVRREDREARADQTRLGSGLVAQRKHVAAQQLPAAVADLHAQVPPEVQVLRARETSRAEWSPSRRENSRSLPRSRRH